MGAVVVSGCSRSRGEIPDGRKVALACVCSDIGGFVRDDAAATGGVEGRLGGDEVGRRRRGRRGICILGEGGEEEGEEEEGTALEW